MQDFKTHKAEQLRAKFHGEKSVKYSVMAPGPVNLHPKVQESLALDMIHHRTPEFDKILARTLSNLKEIFRTQEPVYILTSTGSGGMEALLTNVLSPGDKVLGIDSGKFGERWCEMAQAFGAKLSTIKTEWGNPVKVTDVAHHLKDHPDTKIVMCQACETSTGVLHPIRELGEIIHNYPDTLFLVDGITALGAMPLPMDQWFIDGLVGGSQKAFMLPTGMSFISFSKKAQKQFDQAKTPRFYFDIRKERQANLKGETFFSSNVTLIRALDVMLQIILSRGLEDHFLEISKRANFTRHFAPKLGLKSYSESPSNTISAYLVPPGMDSQKVRTLLEQKFHITIMGGQDQAKGKIIRIGHMGHIDWSQMIQLFESLAHVMRELDENYKPEVSLESLKIEMRGWIGHD